MKHDDGKRGYQYGPCSKRKEDLGPVVIAISDDVRLRRESKSKLYFIEVYDYGCGWYRHSSAVEPRSDAESRARDIAGV